MQLTEETSSLEEEEVTDFGYNQMGYTPSECLLPRQAVRTFEDTFQDEEQVA